jgi:hypothetical protein
MNDILKADANLPPYRTIPLTNVEKAFLDKVPQRYETKPTTTYPSASEAHELLTIRRAQRKAEEKLKYVITPNNQRNPILYPIYGYFAE